MSDLQAIADRVEPVSRKRVFITGLAGFALSSALGGAAGRRVPLRDEG